MFTREKQLEIANGLSNNPAVAILGPRQVGKTTLALEIARNHDAVYLDLENPLDLQKLADAQSYLDMHREKLVILDEVQHHPGLFKILRGVIDERRREGKGNGRFLILGSATNELLKQSSESLAGRIKYVELSALNPLEISATNPNQIMALWSRGGFPTSFSAANDDVSFDWRQNFIRTYLERDIPQLGPRIAASTLLRFWTMLAHAQGELLNASKLAGSLGVESVTVSRYIDLMVDLMLVRRLQPWFGNIKKRLVKSPRIYVRDSGITHALLQIRNYEVLLSHPVYGKSWEGFVIENIIAALPFGVQPYFYRTAAGAEIDLLLAFGIQEFWAIEIKASSNPKVAKGFHSACEDLNVQQKFIIYSGNETFPAAQNTTVLSLYHFLQKLKVR